MINVVHFGFFCLVHAPCYVAVPRLERVHLPHTNSGNAKILSSMAVDIWVGQTNYNHF
jgi:hypothetical protein